MTINNRIYQYQPNGTWQKRNVNTLRHIVVHHSAYGLNNESNDTRLNTMMGWHVNNGWPGLSYHYVVMRDGQIYQINNDDDLTWTDSHNTFSLSVLVDGYFHTPNNDQPTQEQLKSLHWLAHTLQKKYSHTVRGDNWLIAHRDMSRLYGTPATACCGDILYSKLNEIKFRPLQDTNPINNLNTMNESLIKFIQGNGGSLESKQLLVNAILNGDTVYFDTYFPLWLVEVENERKAAEKKSEPLVNQLIQESKKDESKKLSDLVPNNGLTSTISTIALAIGPMLITLGVLTPDQFAQMNNPELINAVGGLITVLGVIYNQLRKSN